MAPTPLSRHISATPQQIAGDGCYLRELLHPARDGSPVRYSLAYAYLEPGDRTLSHSLEQSEVYYGLSGEGTLIVDGSPYPLKSGSCICVPPGFSQLLINESEARLEFLCIVDPPWSAEG